jgi:alpha-mannosidase
MLKVAFPVDVHSNRATFEIQYGHVERPTHSNTSWDWARFEVCAHRWADLSEPDYGVALLNDCKYGYDISGNVMRLSLLRSPTSPDPEADQGRQEFTYALFPHQGDLRRGGVVQAAYELNSPLRAVPADRDALGLREASFLQSDNDGVIVEAVKRAEDSDALIVRLYEAYGQRHSSRLSTARHIAAAAVVDLLERELSPLDTDGQTVALEFRPFEIKTVRLTLA